VLKKVMIVLVGLALGGTVLQTEAFARDGGHGGSFVGGGFGGHGGFGHSGRGHFFGGSAFDDGDWPYDDDYGNCYWISNHRYVCR